MFQLYYFVESIHKNSLFTCDIHFILIKFGLCNISPLHMLLDPEFDPIQHVTFLM